MLAITLLGIIPILLIFSVVHLVGGAPCTFREGNYQLDWVVSGASGGSQLGAGNVGLVYFRLTYTNFPAQMDLWTAVAFGESMNAGLDAIIIKSVGGRLSITDEFVHGYGPSHADPQQNVYVQDMRYVNGTLQARFARPSWASEPGYDRDLRGCTTWQFVTSLGHMRPDHVGKHYGTPISRSICLDQCGMTG